MTDPKPLRILDAFGPDLEHATLVAVHPDETHDANGDPVAERRTLLLSLSGDAATFVEQVPLALTQCWTSANGTVYFGKVGSNALSVRSGGEWHEEIFSDDPVGYVRFLWGMSGATPREDRLFISSMDGVFIRSADGWVRHDAPGEGFPHQIHGRKPDEVYIGGDQLVQYDGTALVELEGPDDDAIPALWVTQDDRLLGGDTRLSITNADGGWERIATKIGDFLVMAEFGGHVYAATYEGGVARVHPGVPERVTPEFDVDRVVSFSDGLVAPGEPHSMVFDGQTWRSISVPTCHVGATP